MVQVPFSFSSFLSIILFVCLNKGGGGLPVNTFLKHFLLRAGSAAQTQGSCGPAPRRGEVAEPGPPHGDVLRHFGGVFAAACDTAEEDSGQS